MNINAQVKTKAREEKVQKITNNQYRIWVKDAPEKGRANKKVIKLFADHFCVPRSHIVIISGLKSSTKIISIQK